MERVEPKGAQSVPLFVAVRLWGGRTMALMNIEEALLDRISRATAKELKRRRDAAKLSPCQAPTADSAAAPPVRKVDLGHSLVHSADAATPVERRVRTR